MRKSERWSGVALLLGIVMGSVAWGARTPARRTRQAPVGDARAVIKLTPETMELGPGEVLILELALKNPYGHPTIASASLKAPDSLQLSQPQWDGPMPAWGAKWYTRVQADADAKSGSYPLPLTYYVDRDGEYAAKLSVTVKKPIDVEMLPDMAAGAVKFRVTNRLKARVERGRVELKNDDRLLQNQVSAEFGPIAPGATEEISIPVMSNALAPGMGYRFHATAQTYAGYKTEFSRTLLFYGERK